jgi:hypothetical protein
VCRLSRSLYGLRQAPWAWFTRFVDFILTLGFVQSKADPSLFVLKQGRDTAYLLLYVDDIILSALTSALLTHITARLKSEFAIKDLRPLRLFLGIDVQRRKDGFQLSQAAYAHDVLECTGMTNCKPAPTPTDAKAKLSSSDGAPVTDALWYHSMAALFNTLPSPAPTSRTQCSRYACICMRRGDCHAAMLERIL